MYILLGIVQLTNSWSGIWDKVEATPTQSVASGMLQVID